MLHGISQEEYQEARARGILGEIQEAEPDAVSEAFNAMLEEYEATLRGMRESLERLEREL